VMEPGPRIAEGNKGRNLGASAAVHV